MTNKPTEAEKALEKRIKELEERIKRLEIKRQSDPLRVIGTDLEGNPLKIIVK